MYEKLPNYVITPKIHAIYFHVIDYIELNKKSLGWISEHAFESVHFDFDLTWSRYKCIKINTKFKDRLVRAVLNYNLTNI